MAFIAIACYQMYRVLDLFSGIGGFSLGLERTGGFKTIQFCEIDPFCRKVLAKHWPDVPCHEDVRTLDGRSISADVVCGGFPCQDISVAGKRVGIDGARSGLWTEYSRIIGELRPKFVIVENTANLLALGMGRVVGDLATHGYDAVWRSIQAAEVGAPHSRDRVWIVAYPSGEGLEGQWLAGRIQKEIAEFSIAHDVADAESIEGLYGLRERGVCALLDGVPHRPRWGGQQWPKAESALCRMDDGIPDRVQRTAALGNAIVPQIAEILGRAILQSESTVLDPL